MRPVRLLSNTVTPSNTLVFMKVRKPMYSSSQNSCTGYPFVYLYDGKEATEITGPLSLDVIDSCIENIEEGDIE